MSQRAERTPRRMRRHRLGIIVGTGVAKRLRVPILGITIPIGDIAYARMKGMGMVAKVFAPPGMGLRNLSHSNDRLHHWLDEFRPTALMGHSQGAIRAFGYGIDSVRRGNHGNLEVVIALGGPLGGSWLAVLFTRVLPGWLVRHLACVIDMSPDSAHLATLRKELTELLLSTPPEGRPRFICASVWGEQLCTGHSPFLRVLDPKTGAELVENYYIGLERPEWLPEWVVFVPVRRRTLDLLLRLDHFTEVIDDRCLGFFAGILDAPYQSPQAKPTTKLAPAAHKKAA